VASSSLKENINPPVMASTLKKPPVLRKTVSSEQTQKAPLN
jgi:hypothetical protein